MFDDPGRLRAERDSLAAYLVGQATLAAENRQLRELLGLRERLAPSFVPAEVVHIPRSNEGYFQLTAGADQGIAPGASIVGAQGLIGRVLEVDRAVSFGIDWMNPEFRASAMTVEGDVYGIVVPRRIEGEPLLVLTGTPRHVELTPGTLIVTSGHGGVFPRGIPVGTVVGLESQEEDWQRNYVIRPLVPPSEMTYVLVLGGEERTLEGRDLAQHWGIRIPEPPPPPDPDLVAAAAPVTAAPPPVPADTGPQLLGTPIQPPPN
jgi:rod shape-determining protein MreC